MRTVTFVRHGRAAAAWDADLDPGLDTLGHEQAAAVARHLAGTGPRPVLTSPLRRTRETAAPLAARWGLEPVVEVRVAEVPSPGLDLAERGEWLGRVLAGRWPDLGPELIAWRAALLDAVRGFEDGTVVFSHYVAINAVIGAATGDDRVTSVPLANGSISVVEVDGHDLHLREAGWAGHVDGSIGPVR